MEYSQGIENCTESFTSEISTLTIFILIQGLLDIYC